jgi:DNA polymerase-3 subunit delta
MGAAKAKSAGLDPVVAVLGSDEAEIKRRARELAESMTPEGDFGVDIVDGDVDGADAAASRVHDAIQALMTFPFFGGEKLVWLKNARFLGDTVTGRSATVLEALEKLQEVLASGLPAGTRFLLSALEVDKRRAFYKALGKLGKVQVFDRVDTGKAGWEEAAADVVRQCAAERGLELEEGALELFALFTGGDRQTVVNESEKLDLYLGTGRRRVTEADVRLLVPLSREGIIFEIGNAIAARDLERSLELLGQLLHQGESAIGILLVAIYPTVRSLLLVKDLMVRHRLSKPGQPFFFGKTLEKLPAEATEHLPRKKDGTLNAYALGLAAMHAHRYELPELKAALLHCGDANMQLVTSMLEPEVVLGQLIVRIVAAERGVGR